jgi:hypothetical protein
MFKYLNQISRTTPWVIQVNEFFTLASKLAVANGGLETCKTISIFCGANWVGIAVGALVNDP